MASGMDMKSANATYNGFIKASVWGTVAVVVIVAFVVSLLAS